MTVLRNPLNFRKLVAFGAAASTVLWVAIGWAQNVTFTPTPDLQELGQKVESRSKPPIVTTEEENILASKGYVKLGSIAGTVTGTKAGAAQKLDDSIFVKAAAVGGDVFRFDKRGVPAQATETIGPEEKTHRVCANWETSTNYTYENAPDSCYTDWQHIRRCSPGGTRQVPHTTRTCTNWENTVSVVGRETTLTISVLSSEGTVWRSDPNLASAIALDQRNNANSPMPANSIAASFSYAIYYNDIAKVEAMLKDFPRLANTVEVDYPDTKPLDHSVTLDHKEMIDVLLAHGAHINGKDLHGWTVLDTACSSELAKSAEMAEFLISRGADVNAEDYDGFTVLDLCRDKRVARVLRKHGGHSGHK